MKNPFEERAPSGWPVKTIIWGCVVDQLRIVRNADADKLRAIIAWPGTSTTTRKRAEA